MTRTPFDDIDEAIRSEFGRPRTLGEIVADARGLSDVRTGKALSGSLVGAPMAALLTNPSLGTTRRGVAHPATPVAVPLLDVITIVDDVVDGVIEPVTVAMLNAADVVAEGDIAGESTITYTHGAATVLPNLSHYIEVTTQALRHDRKLRADIDTLLVAGLRVKVETQVAAALTAATGVVEHPFVVDVATTVRGGIAAAQSAFRELGDGPVVVVLSPDDHAELDLADFDVSVWPARIVSSPALPAGTGYIGRLGLAVFLYTSSVSVAVNVGTFDDQFVQNRATILADSDALAHVAAPSAIVKVALTEDLS